MYSKRNRRYILIGALVITLAAVITWQATGGDYYTKFQVVEQVEKEIDRSNPLAAAGFYEGDTQTETVTRDEFRFGLLPTPSGIMDKHALSVASVVGPVWLLALALVWIGRRRQRKIHTA